MGVAGSNRRLDAARHGAACHRIASVKMVEIRVPAEVAIVQAALGGKVMAGWLSLAGVSTAMASTCM